MSTSTRDTTPRTATRPHVTRTYRYAAVICREGGTWVDWEAEFSRVAFICPREGTPIPPGHGELNRLADAQARRRFPNAEHIFILWIRLRRSQDVP